jgi:hypothetical protein
MVGKHLPRTVRTVFESQLRGRITRLCQQKTAREFRAVSLGRYRYESARLCLHSALRLGGLTACASPRRAPVGGFSLSRRATRPRANRVTVWVSVRAVHVCESTRLRTRLSMIEREFKRGGEPSVLELRRGQSGAIRDSYLSPTSSRGTPYCSTFRPNRTYNFSGFPRRPHRLHP